MFEAWHVPEACFKERLRICASCPEMENTMLGERCKVCSCFMRVKAKMSFAECPKGKWAAEPPKE